MLLLRRRQRRAGGAAMSESSSQSRHCRGHGHAPEGMSARRLVAAFWQTDKDRLFGDDDAVIRRSVVPRSHASTEVSKSSRSRTSKVLLEAGGGKRSWHNDPGQWISADAMSKCSAMEIGRRSPDDVSRCPEEKAMHLKDLYNSLIASKELAKVLSHIWGELNPSTVSLISALRSELDLARAHVRRLIKEHESERIETDGFRKQLLEEMQSWKAKQKEKAAAALQYTVTELDSEKKSRKRAEKANKKLGVALVDTESALSAATDELERERKCKARVEKMCSELMRGIAEDRAALEAMRRETEQAREELEREREMLQLADEWREQRVQMKLLEARLQFEEKNSAVSQLHDELQAYLDANKDNGSKMDRNHAYENVGGPEESDGAIAGNGSDDCESEGSDMHSIELKVDGNSKCCTWSYDTPSSRGNLSSMRGGIIVQEMDDALEGDWAEGCSNGMLNFDHDEERYQAIEDLREQMLAGSGLSMSQGRENAETDYCIL